MADDLISRQAVKNLIAARYECPEICCAEIDKIPSIEAAPVRRGKWEWLGPYRGANEGWIGTCSVCKKRVRFFEKDYCPLCGADMREDIERSVLG